jgi:hypothetical protein
MTQDIIIRNLREALAAAQAAAQAAACPEPTNQGLRTLGEWYLLIVPLFTLVDDLSSGVFGVQD